MCPILHLQKFRRYNTAEKKCKYNWTYIALSFSFEGCQAYDKHDRNLHGGWFIISLEVQILSHLVQKDANSEKGWLFKRRSLLYLRSCPDWNFSTDNDCKTQIQPRGHIVFLELCAQLCPSLEFLWNSICIWENAVTQSRNC